MNNTFSFVWYCSVFCIVLLPNEVSTWNSKRNLKFKYSEYSKTCSLPKALFCSNSHCLSLQVCLGLRHQVNQGSSSLGKTPIVIYKSKSFPNSFRSERPFPDFAIFVRISFYTSVPTYRTRCMKSWDFPRSSVNLVVCSLLRTRSKQQ